MSYIKLFGCLNNQAITEKVIRYQGRVDLKKKLMHQFIDWDVSLLEGTKYLRSMETIKFICDRYYDECTLTVDENMTLSFKDQVNEYTHFKAKVFVNNALVSISDLKPLDHQGRVYDAMSFVVESVGVEVSYGICKLMGDVFDNVRENTDPFGAVQVCHFIYGGKEYVINFEKEMH